MDNTDKRLKEWLGADNQIGIDIWHKKYQHGDESFDEWLDRVSAGDGDIREEIEAKRFLFGGRILANRGLFRNGTKVTYSNCYVLPAPEDNIESIYDTAGKLARTFSYGGGVGIDISKLAPRGAKVNNTAKETSGAVSFMDLYSMTTGLIGQNGRRGALMISIDCHHPDLEEFIDIKSDLDKVTTANISVRVDDDFMRAVRNNGTVTLSFTRPETDMVVEKKVNAKELFHKLAYNNWDMGEPGILFWDNIKSWNMLSNDSEFEYAGTNPCAEEPLPAGGSCLLGSINLSEFVENPYTSERSFDMLTFRQTVRRAVVALNDVLDEGLPLHPLQIQRDTVRDWRQIGLGVFGIADMLIKMGLNYGSEEGRKFCAIIAQALAKTAVEASHNLAKQYGAYPNYTDKVFQTPYIKNIIMVDEARREMAKDGLRNSQLLTIAPTGTLSTMLQVSGGIEPFFATSWERTTKSLHGEDVVYTEHPKTITELLEVVGDDKMPDYVVTSGDINPMARIKMQSVWQRYIDASISSTINLANDHTVEDVEAIYMAAWEHGLKGVTIFRDGCRRVAILNTPPKDENGQIDDENIKIELSEYGGLRRGDIMDVSDDLLSSKRTLINGCGKMYLHLDFDEVTGEPLETWIECGSGGGCERNLAFISRLMSLALRGGIPIECIIDQAMSVKPCKAYCDRTKARHDTSKGTSCPQSIGYALEELNYKIQERCFTDDDMTYVAEEDVVLDEYLDEDSIEKPRCPECGEELIFEGGCNICKSCGWSRCD